MKLPKVFLLIIIALMTVSLSTKSSAPSILAADSESSTVKFHVITDNDSEEKPSLPGPPQEPERPNLPQVNEDRNFSFTPSGLILLTLLLGGFIIYRKEKIDEKIT